MAQSTYSNFKGLAIQKNSYTAEQTSLEEATNVTLIYDDMITSRRGFTQDREYEAGQQINNIFEYQGDVFSVSQNRLYRNIVNLTTAQAATTATSAVITITKANHGLTTNDFITYFNVSDADPFINAFPNRHASYYGTRQVTVTGANTFTILADEVATLSITSGTTAATYRYYTRVTGASVAVTSGLTNVAREIEANKNAYFLSDNGPLKLERNDLPLLKSGIPQALDLSVVLGKQGNAPATDFYLGTIRANSQTAYRVVFGRKDANMNLVLGAPSQIFIVINPLFTPTSFSRGADNSGGAGFATVTVTIANDLIVNDIIYAFGTVTTGASIDDETAYTVLSSSPTQFTFNVPNAVTTITEFTYGIQQTARLSFEIPSEILSTEYIWQLYRTVPASGVDQTTPPNNQFKLVKEANITAQQVTDRVVYYKDIIPDELLGAELYTNIDTREGELQANARAPFARDIAIFQNYTFFANTISYQHLDLAVVAASNISSGTTLSIGGVTSYIFRRNTADDLAVANNMQLSPATRTGNVVTVTQASHGYTTGDTIWLFDSNFANIIPVASKTITVTGANTFTFADTNANETTAGFYVIYEGRTDSLGNYLIKASFSSSVVSTTAAQAIQVTARSVTKANNRNPASITYAQYTSGILDAQGKMQFSAKNLTQAAFAVTISSATDGLAFFPTLPTVGTTVQSEVDTEPNALYCSKVSEPEAVPSANKFLVGAAKDIYRIHALRDSIIILKQDGAYRLNGDSPANFSITLIDPTVELKAKKSSTILNNEVYCMTNQGITAVNESRALTVSRPIEPLFSSIINNPNLDSLTAAFAYDSDRSYLISTIKPNSQSSTADVVYCYNYETASWTKWDTYFFNGTVLPVGDKIYYTDNSRASIYIERKDATKRDFTGQEYGVPVYRGYVATIEANTGSPEVTVTLAIDHNLAVGQLISVDSVGNLIATVFSGGSADLTGLRVVTAVSTNKIFKFNAATSAITIASDFIRYQSWISEQNVTAQATNGSNSILITTSQPHQLLTGMGISILSSTLTTAFPVSSNVTGFRSVTVLSPTTFTITATTTAGANQTATVNIVDRRQTYYYNTISSTPSVSPELGDAIIYNGIIYKIIELYRYSSTQYLVRLNFEALFNSMQAPLLHSAYELKIKFSPLILGDSAKLKLCTEFKAQFRRDSNCSALKLDYASDSVKTSGVVEWNNRVGSDRSIISFGGWGEIAWGDDPWGEGEAVTRDFTTGASVQLRTYVNLSAALCTYLQPILIHKFAGEELNLQAISVDYNYISSRTTR